MLLHWSLGCKEKKRPENVEYGTFKRSKCFSSLQTTLLPLRSNMSWGISSNFHDFLAIYTFYLFIYFKTLMPSLCEFSCKSLHQESRHALHFELLLIGGALRSVDPRLNSGAGRGRVSLSVSSRSSPSLRRAPELNATAACVQHPASTAHSFRSC